MIYTFEELHERLVAKGKFSANFQRSTRSNPSQVEDYMYSEILSGCEHKRFCKGLKLFHVLFEFNRVCITTIYSYKSARIQVFKPFTREEFEQVLTDFKSLEEIYPITVEIPRGSFKQHCFTLWAKKKE